MEKERVCADCGSKEVRVISSGRHLCMSCYNKPEVGNMKAFQKRVIKEKSDLEEKFNKLSLFMGSEDFSKIDFAEKLRLQRQQSIMESYIEVLGERIRNFK